MRPHFQLILAILGVLLLLMPLASRAQDSGATLLLLKEGTAVLEEQFRDVLDRSLETRKDLLDAISDLHSVAEAMKAEKNMILGAFPRGVPPKEIPVLINLVWKLGYQAGTAEMLADEWKRLLASPLNQDAPAEKTDQ